MPKIGSRMRFLRVAWIALFCAFFSGCAVPMRVPTKTRNVSGEWGKKLDLDFINVGTTTREEVAQKLGWIDTGVRDDRFFFGRWAQSSWGFGVGTDRNWTHHNLLIDFDEKNVVSRISFFPDKDILKMLSERVSVNPGRPLDLATPIEIPVEYIRLGKHFLGTLVLGKDVFEFLSDREKAHDFKTSPRNISHLSMGHWVSPEEQSPLHPAENVVETIHFRQRTSVGSKMDVQVDVRTAMILIKYIAQIHSGS